MSEKKPDPYRFYAHSFGSDSSIWQPLQAHLSGVSRLAGKFAERFQAEELARTAGWLHDLGKYTERFQKRLTGEAVRVDHATRGAIIARNRYDTLGTLMAYVIAGHHAGLANGQDRNGERTCLCDRLAAELPLLDPVWEREIALPASLSQPPLKLRKAFEQFQFAFFTRMLFSCLTDADFLDTEAFYAQAEGRPLWRNREQPDLSVLRNRLNTRLKQFKSGTDVNRLRADILTHVRAQAAMTPGLFSLTVPTGGGKTLASLAFALDHAIEHGLQRVIFVIPFTSIVEQNAKVFREALGDLGDAAALEHHSAFVASPPPKNDPDRYQSQEKLSSHLHEHEQTLCDRH